MRTFTAGFRDRFGGAYVLGELQRQHQDSLVLRGEATVLSLPLRQQTLIQRHARVQMQQKASTSVKSGRIRSPQRQVN